MNRRAGFALVAAGGAFGTLGRYAVMRAFPAAPGAFPWGTLAVNLVGAAAIGVLAARGVVGSRAVGDALLGAGCDWPSGRPLRRSVPLPTPRRSRSWRSPSVG